MDRNEFDRLLRLDKYAKWVWLVGCLVLLGSSFLDGTLGMVLFVGGILAAFGGTIWGWAIEKQMDRTWFAASWSKVDEPAEEQQPGETRD
jgi:Zn-dependent protease with chaperone function